jgi:hypothetical protein
MCCSAFRLSRKHEGYLDEELFDDIIEQRRTEADEFFWCISPLPMADDLRNIQRQALWDAVDQAVLPFHLGAVGERRSGYAATTTWEKRHP